MKFSPDSDSFAGFPFFRRIPIRSPDSDLMFRRIPVLGVVQVIDRSRCSREEGIIDMDGPVWQGEEPQAYLTRRREGHEEEQKALGVEKKKFRRIPILVEFGIVGQAFIGLRAFR